MYKAYICLALLAGTPGLATSSVTGVTPGAVKVFKDWTVGCDNNFDCQAVALIDEQEPDDHLSVVITRPSGPGASLKIVIPHDMLKDSSYSVRVDGKTMTRQTVQAADAPIQLTGAAALNLARAMARGNFIRLFDQSGAEIGNASLAGASAALRYMDVQQGRVGIKHAIVATSGKPKAGKRVAAPVITVRKITPTNMLPDTSALVALSERSPCAAERFESTEDTAYSLGGDADGPQALVLLNCGAGAYNFSSGIYTARRGSNGVWSFAPAKFDYRTAGLSAESGVPLLVNASWDAATQTISSYNKGRGLGDCGFSESYVWDGQMFRLTSASFMGECRGSTDWIPIWRAEVKLTP